MNAFITFITLLYVCPPTPIQTCWLLLQEQCRYAKCLTVMKSWGDLDLDKCMYWILIYLFLHQITSNNMNLSICTYVEYHSFPENQRKKRVQSPYFIDKFLSQFFCPSHLWFTGVIWSSLACSRGNASAKMVHVEHATISRQTAYSAGILS